jgi:hypothetical protein
MDVERKIKELEIEVSRLSAQRMSDRDDEIPVPVCGPVIKKEVLSSDNPAPQRIVSFGCTNAGLVITMKLGRAYFKGVPKTIVSWPTNGIVTISATTYGYVSWDLSNGTPTFNTAATDPGAGDDDTEIWLIFIATVAGGKITELEECQHGDMRSMGNA